jgi:hypothetical protein
MIVFLTGSSWEAKEDLPFLRQAVQTIQENGGVLARDWIEPTFKQAEKSSAKKPSINWEKVMRGTVDAISRADIIIVEGTSYRFSQGYQVALALQLKKPVLFISRRSHNDRSVSGIKNKLLVAMTYNNEKDLREIISKFMLENTISTKDLRFNFFIDRQIYNYLRSMAYETGKNKSEIIRDLINKEIKRGDD